MESIKGLIPFVRKAGELAAARQGTVLRSFKSDGSVLTQVDRDVDRFLRDSIISLYPEALVISEENVTAAGETAGGAATTAAPEDGPLPGDLGEFIFAVDPVDGTDSFSQGMPGWAVSVGLLDRSYRPIAGIVFAPKWAGPPGEGAFLFADIGRTALLNGEELPPVGEVTHGAPQVFAGSSIHKRFRSDAFPGKVRNVGSAAIHIVSPLLHRAVVGTIFNPNYIWDIAGAHGIILSHGLTMEYLDGRPIDYARLVHRQRAEGPIVAGTRQGVEMIRGSFRLLE